MTETTTDAMQGVHPALATALRGKKYETLTPVQSAIIDAKLAHKDLLVSAQTGSGKTVAFGLALASTMLGDDLVLPAAETPMALIIAPTRELALQVKRELDWLYNDAGARVASCVGGMDMRDERRALGRGAHIVVGTPGRLCDHIKRKSLNLSEIQAVVLDEADEMLKMGFREEIELILAAAPDTHRSLLFSATVPKTIVTLAKKFQRDSVRVNVVSDAKQHLDIAYRAMVVSKNDVENAIVNVLRFYDAKNAIVFGDTRMAVNRMTQRFNNRGFSVVSLSGELNQKQRSDALQALRVGRARVCIATDVAARGLDLPDLELVVHASIPKNAEALLHRSGRTGRAGRKGVSALIVPQQGRRRADRVLKDAKVTPEWTTPPSAADVQAKDNERMLEGMTLDTPLNDEEGTMVERMLKQFEPGHIAAAFIRQYRKTHSAPEELSSAPYDPSDDKRGGAKHRKERSGPRRDFDNGVWFALNLGRKQNAEPRWILPMLANSGELRKGEIGAIKITETRTYIEINPTGVERFVNAIGPDGKIEKAITASRVDGTPDFSDDRPVYKPREDKPRSKKSWDKKGDGDRGYEKRPKRTGAPKDSYKDKRSKTFDAANAQTDEYDPAKDDFFNDAPRVGADGKPKKPHKKKLARAKARAEEAAKGKHKSTRSKSGGSSKSGGPKLKRKKRTR